MHSEPQIFGLFLLGMFGLVGLILALTWKNRPFAVTRLLLVAGVLFFLIGAALVAQEMKQLRKYVSLRDWPSVQGVIVESRVIGNRARRPDIVYQYTVSGVTRTDSTSLDPPNFGGRNAKREAAEAVAHEYPAGKQVTIHYNPSNPAESRMKITPPWSLYGQAGFGGLLFGIGLFLAVGFFYPRPTKSSS